MGETAEVLLEEFTEERDELAHSLVRLLSIMDDVDKKSDYIEYMWGELPKLPKRDRETCAKVLRVFETEVPSELQTAALDSLR